MRANICSPGYRIAVDYELELLEELELDELTLDELLEFDELLEELELDDSSCIQMIDKRSPDFGPGNCRLPVLKLSTSLTLTSPLSIVSTRVACMI